MIVDDHPVMRHGIRSLLEHDGRFTVVGEADSAGAAVELARAAKPRVAIVDINLRASSGLEFARILKTQIPGIRILVVSLHDEEVFAERALHAGADGYVMKLEAVNSLIPALDSILAGGMYISESLQKRMLRRAAQSGSLLPVMATLSPRELQVFEYLGRGFSNREIAAELGLSVKTVDSFRENLKGKLNLKTSAALTRFAVQWGKGRGV